MKRAIFLALMLTGCIDPQATFNQSFPPYRGLPVEQLFPKWGPPSAMIVVPENQDRVYTWNSAAVYTYRSSTTSTGTIGTTPFTITTPTTESVQLACVVKVATNPDGRIMAFTSRGNAAPCDDMAKKLLD